MSSHKTKKLIRLQSGGLPLFYSIMKKTEIRTILEAHLPHHGNEKIPAVDSLLLLILNLAIGKEPLYKLQSWSEQIDLRSIGMSTFAANTLTDDRFGRALDKLYDLDRASLMTEYILNVIDKYDIQNDRVHNDSTTIKAYGKMPGETNTGVELRLGHSKDHRPDLKQLLFSLSISSDGAVPIHYKCYSGNRTDDTTHIETWNTLRRITRNAEFIYVADCKVCTDKQLLHITTQGGRVITIIPKTWKEVGDFKDELRRRKKRKHEILRKLKQGSECKIDYYSVYEGEQKTYKRGYRIHWIHSSEKRNRDRQLRQDRLKKTGIALTKLKEKLNKRNLKNEKAIGIEVKKILAKYQASRFVMVEVVQIEHVIKKQVGRGRPGTHTRYKVVRNQIFTLRWEKNHKTLRAECRVDGIFPLLSTDDKLSAKSVLKAYKYQPRIEKRFSQFKSIHNAAPLFFKNIERIEANMFLFFVALVMQSLLEREIRKSMEREGICTLDIYPEDRESKYPTTHCVMNLFQGVSRYEIMEGDVVVEQYKDDLSQTQQQVLSLLKLNESSYWDKEIEN